ncbi:hypothetical protein ABID29_001597 [Streptococcus rupicaprae]|uniref:DUF4767 domain-containing protein n=1 Tax=Streptococcus rupicaprae TaxID=759619 RepID=A0ABV2FIT6_9STRE
MSKQARWAALFKEVIGRNPSPEEFQLGKASDFDFKQIKTIAGQVVEGTSTESESVLADDLEPVSTESSQGSQAVFEPVGVPLEKGAKKKRSFFKVALGLLAVLLLAGYFYGKTQTKPEVKADALVKAINQNDYETVADLLSETGRDWTEKDAKDFVIYLESQEQSLSEILDSMAIDRFKTPYSDANGNKLLGLQETGKKWLLFPDYQFVTYPLELTATSDLEDLRIAGKTVEQGERVPVVTLPFLPQDVTVEGQTAYGSVKTEIFLDLDQASHNQLDLPLELSRQTITAHLPFKTEDLEEVSLLINEKEVAQGLEAEIETFGLEALEIKAKFKVKDQVFETKPSKAKASDLDNVSLALRPEDAAKVKGLLAKLAEKRQPLVLWSNQKAEQLASFMVSWGNAMNQPGYQDITHQETGFVLENRVRLNQVQDVTTEFSQDGTGNSDYQVLAIYRYSYGGNQVHTYYFTIRADGAPIVLYSAQNQGGMPDDKYYMKETANEELKAGFARIVHS